MSTITALHFLLTKEDAYPSRHLISNHPSWSHLNWIGAELWRKSVKFTDHSMLSICQECCFQYISFNSLLKGLACRGRASLISSLTEDELQVFRVANLLQEIPPLQVLEWWNYFKILRRKERGLEKAEQGAEAELWTMENEKKI